MNRRTVLGRLLLAGVCALLVGPAVAHANPDGRQNLRDAVADLAKRIKAVVEKENQRSVRVGHFSPGGKGLDDSNSGAGISGQLAQALGSFVNKDSLLEVKGDYLYLPDKQGGDSKIMVVKIGAQIINTDNGDVVKIFTGQEAAVVAANPDIAKITNITGSLNPEGSYTERNKQIQELKEKPSIAVDGTLIKSSKESPYAVQLLVKPLQNHENIVAQPKLPLPPDGGKAFVPIGKGELYEVRVFNFSTQETAVTLTVDGLDDFTFSDDRKPDGTPKFSHWIVPAAKDGKPGVQTIPGWHKTADPHRKDNFLSFLVTEYGQGGASKFPTKSQGKVGIITVSFAYSFPEGTARSSGDVETGFGPAQN